MSCRNFRGASARISGESIESERENFAERGEQSGRGFCCPVPLPKPRLRPLFRRQQRVQRRYRWHLCVARHGGTIPGKNRAFTTLVDPISPPSVPRRGEG